MKQLQQIVGEKYLLTDQGDLRKYGIDRTTGWQPSPVAVVLPDCNEQIQHIVRLANTEGFSVVPSGGRTGLSGGAVACKGELVLALDRMNGVLEFNPIDYTVCVQAGMITRQLQEYAGQHDLFYPVDFASSASSQIGGNIATNAGGINVVRYGSTREWVLGLTVVTGAGELLSLNHGLVKNNSGYDFRHLFIGSEGTLGIICEATLKLATPPQNLSVMLLAVESFPAVMNILQAFIRKIELTAFECFSKNCLDVVIAHSGLQAPFPSLQQEAPFCVLIEFEQKTDVEMELANSLFGAFLEQGMVVGGVVSQSVHQSKSLWRYREDISSILHRWQPYKHDISVKVSRLSEFVERANQVFIENFPQLEVMWYGHAGDGNLHLNIPKPEGMDSAEFALCCSKLECKVVHLVGEFNGSISAEHGIGLLKKNALNSTRSETEIELMRQLKKVFDPNGVMNPGKIFD